MSVPGSRPLPNFTKSQSAHVKSKPIVRKGYNPMPLIGLGLVGTAGWAVACFIATANLAGGLSQLWGMSGAGWAMASLALGLPLFLLWNWIIGSIQNNLMKISLLNQLNAQTLANQKSERLTSAIGFETQQHMSAVSQELELRVQGFHKLTEDLSSVLVGLTAQVESQNQELDQVTGRMKDRATEIGQYLEHQSQQIDAAETRVEALTDRVTQTSDQMLDLANELKNEVEQPIQNGCATLAQTVQNVGADVERLEAQFASIAALHDSTIAANDTARARLVQETEHMTLVADAAAANIDSLSVKLADQITSLDQIGLGAAQEIAGVSEKFSDQAEHLSQVTSQLSDEITSISNRIDNQNNQLATLQSSANEYGESIAKQLQENAGILSHETDMALTRLREAMESQLEQLNSGVDSKTAYVEGTARRLEKRMAESLQSGDDMLSNIGKMHADALTRLDTALSDSIEGYKSQATTAMVALNAEANALSRQEIDNLDAVKERIASTLEDLRQSCEDTVDEMSIRAKATASLLEIQTEALDTRLNSVSRTSDELHERLSNASNALGKSLIESLDEQLREHSEAADNRTHVLNQSLDKALASWRENLDIAIRETQDQAHSIVAKTAESLRHVSSESIDSMHVAGAQIPVLANGIIAAASQARGEVSEIANDLNLTLENVMTNVDDTSRATQLMQRDLAQAPARLEAATKSLATMSQTITNHAQSVEIHANAIEGAGDKALAKLGQHVDALRETATVTDQILESQNTRLEAGTKEVIDSTKKLASDVTRLTASAERSLKDIAQLSTNTVGAVSATSETVGHQIEGFARQANDLRSLLTSIGGLANEHGMALQKVGEEAENRAQRLMGLVKDDQRDAFLGSAERLVDRLHGLAVDVDSIMDGDVDPAVIRAFQQGDRGVAVRKLVARQSGNQALGRVAELYMRDAKFKERVDLYVEGFDDLLSRAAKADNSKLLHTTFLTADIGKLYVFLTQSLGLLAAAE